MRLFDTACFELASLFLSDEPSIDSEDNRNHLAAEIQAVIEDFMREKEGDLRLL